MRMPPPRRAGLCGAVAALLLLGWALLLPGGGRDAVAGWLVGLVFWLGLSLGAMALLALHALTGGRWGDALRPVLAPAVSGLPLFLPLAVPLLAGAGALYPGRAVPLRCRRIWCISISTGRASRCAGGGALRLGAGGLPAAAAAPGGRQEAAAALALVFHLAATTMLGFDWMQSLQASFSSTAFGLQWLLLQVLAALAWACLLRPAGRGRRAISPGC
ncbi:hypothetical protein ACFQU7_12965 [Pseudoroseomonas wenyumeiae]